MDPCINKSQRNALEEQLYHIGLAVPFLAVLIYWLYRRFLLPIWPFRGCIWDLFFGFYCPGCGGTRAVEALLQGKIRESFCYHPIVLYGVVLYCVFMGTHVLARITGGKVKGIRFHNWYLYGAVILILINCLVRNVLRIRFDIYI